MKKSKSPLGLKKAQRRLAHDVPLEEWLTALLTSANHDRFIDYQFPTDAHKNEYLASIEGRLEKDVVNLLKHLLIKSCCLGCDESHARWLQDVEASEAETFRELMRVQYYERVFNYFTFRSTDLPWEGITWVLDLLPRHPKKALAALSAYRMAHIYGLPDGRSYGLADAADIIRAKFIGLPGSNAEKVKFVLGLDWRTFECLVERLYDAMGYETELTPPQKDGGRDVIATRRSPGSLEHARIECKFYQEEAVGLSILQRLLGVVSAEKVNKGVIVTTSRFSRPAVRYAGENPRLELIEGSEFVLLMNEHLGPEWPSCIERLVAESEKTRQN
jgi:restriction system protein